MSIMRYDVDCVTWDPEGKLRQVGYACEAVNQGTICLALKSATGGVLVAVKKNPTKLACYQEKIHHISKSVGVSISGMTADARVLCKYMRKQNLVNRNLFGRDLLVEPLASNVSSKFHEKTTTYGKRPFGLGMLMLGYGKGTLEFEDIRYDIGWDCGVWRRCEVD